MTDEQQEAVEEGTACTTELDQASQEATPEMEKIKKFKSEEFTIGTGISRDTHEGVINFRVASFARTLSISDAKQLAAALIQTAEMARSESNIFKFFLKQKTASGDFMKPEQIMGVISAIESEGIPEGMQKTTPPPTAPSNNGSSNA